MSVSDHLAKVLANTYALALKTQNYHWNVEGPNFFALHGMFEAQYTELHATVDEVAERIRALGDYAPGGFQAYAALAEIEDAAGQQSAADMVADLVKGHEALISSAKAAMEAADDADDEGTEGMMADLVTAHEKTVWMLKSTAA